MRRAPSMWPASHSYGSRTSISVALPIVSGVTSIALAGLQNCS